VSDRQDIPGETEGTDSAQAVPDAWGAGSLVPIAKSQRGAQTERAVVSCILVDRQSAVRRGLRWELRLEPDIDVIGETHLGSQGIALAQDLHPDIVIMGMEMVDMDGIEAAERLHALAPDCVIMLLSQNDSVETHRRALAAGARVILEKWTPPVFRSALHDLAQYVRARDVPAWPEMVAVDAV
jgi:CheY-like chemotaxis protein